MVLGLGPSPVLSSRMTKPVVFFTTYHVNYCLYVLIDVGQFVASTRVILESLLSQYSGQTIVEKLCNSVFSMAARQLVRCGDSLCAGGEVVTSGPRQSLRQMLSALSISPQVIFLLDFCTLDISHCALLREFSTLTELLKQICADPTGAPDKVTRVSE